MAAAACGKALLDVSSSRANGPGAGANPAGCPAVAGGNSSQGGGGGAGGSFGTAGGDGGHGAAGGGVALVAALNHAQVVAGERGTDT